MNKREKMLLLLLGGVGLLLGGKAGVGMYLRSLESRDDQIKKLKNNLADVQFKRLEAEQAVNRWHEIGAETLSMDANEATTLFRDEMYSLLKASGMEKQRVDLGQIQRLKNGVRVLHATVIAEGTLHKLVRLMFELYRQPYAVRCSSLQVDPVLAKDAGGKLKMTAKLETLILPANQKVPSIVPAQIGKGREPVNRTLLANFSEYEVIASRKLMEPYVEPPPAKAASPTPAPGTSGVQASVEMSWSAAEGASEYKIYFGTQMPPGELLATQKGTSIHRAGLVAGTSYHWRVDTVNEGGTTKGDVWSFTTEPPKVAQNAPPPPPPPPPPAAPPPDAHLVLTRVISSPRGQQAVLEDPATLPPPGAAPPAVNRAPPPPRAPGARAPVPPAPAAAKPASPASGGSEKRIEVGDPMFGGILVYIHPKGAVTDAKGVQRFHPLGKALRDGVPLKEQPDVLDEFEKLQAQAAGISGRPG